MLGNVLALCHITAEIDNCRSYFLGMWFSLLFVAYMRKNLSIRTRKCSIVAIAEDGNQKLLAK